MKVSEILRRGKANIELQGWCQGDEAAIWGKDGRCCVATAISIQTDLIVKASALHGTRYRDLGAEAVNLFKRANGIPQGEGIATWNDAPERTKDEVLAAYDKAIAAAEESERGA